MPTKLAPNILRRWRRRVLFAALLLDPAAHVLADRFFARALNVGHDRLTKWRTNAKSRTRRPLGSYSNYLIDALRILSASAGFNAGGVLDCPGYRR
jgi:hypothetical protein